MSEEWRPVLGWEGIYEVSNYGKIKSLRRGVNSRHGTRIIREKILNPRKTKYGYLVFSATLKSGGFVTKRVHRAVAEAFINKTNPAANYVNHKDGVRHNNKLENLEWVTPQQNTDHAKEFLGCEWHGERNKTSKLDSIKVLTILTCANHPQISDSMLAKLYNTTATPIFLIRHGKNWKHMFKYRPEAKVDALLKHNDVVVEE